MTNSISVVIEWDYPEDEFWLNPDNIKMALESYCKNTKFTVRVDDPKYAICTCCGKPFTDTHKCDVCGGTHMTYTTFGDSTGKNILKVEYEC